MSNYDFDEKTLYNGQHRHEGMKVVPYVIENKTIAIELGAKPEFMETFHTPKGRKYLVSFTEVSEEQFESYMNSNYSQQIRDFFDDYGNNSYYEQFARCKINGKVCAISNICSKCQKRDENGELRKDNKRGMVSLDALMEDGFDPSVEDPVDTEILFEQLLDAAGKLKDYYPEIIRRTRNGETPAEIVKDLPIKKTQGYERIKKALQFVEEFLK